MNRRRTPPSASPTGRTGEGPDGSLFDLAPARLREALFHRHLPTPLVSLEA